VGVQPASATLAANTAAAAVVIFIIGPLVSLVRMIQT